MADPSRPRGQELLKHRAQEQGHPWDPGGQTDATYFVARFRDYDECFAAIGHSERVWRSQCNGKWGKQILTRICFLCLLIPRPLRNVERPVFDLVIWSSCSISLESPRDTVLRSPPLLVLCLKHRSSTIRGLCVLLHESGDQELWAECAIERWSAWLVFDRSLPEQVI